MSRNARNITKSLVAVAAFGLAVAGAAHADDSSMSMWTGDSYAQFHDLDYAAGKFNTARAPQAKDTAIAVAPMHAMDAHRAAAAHVAPKGLPVNPFRADTGA